MGRIDNEIRITPSVLDRLLDYEPEITQEPIASRSKNLRLLKQSVRRDLEWLLNTRQPPIEIETEMKELNHSILVYGLPDITNISIKDPEEVEYLRRRLCDAIAYFEPRLDDLIVTVVPLYELEHSLRFRIDARLKVEPAPEPITFDTILRLDSGKYQIEGE